MKTKVSLFSGFPNSKPLEVGEIYRIDFKRKDQSYSTYSILAILKSLHRNFIKMDVLCYPESWNNPKPHNDNAIIANRHVVSVTRIEKRDLPLYIGLDTTKIFEHTMRSAWDKPKTPKLLSIF